MAVRIISNWSQTVKKRNEYCTVVNSTVIASKAVKELRRCLFLSLFSYHNPFTPILETISDKTSIT